MKTHCTQRASFRRISLIVAIALCSLVLDEYYLVRSCSVDTVATREAFYGRVKERFNGLRELETRPDAAAALLAAYDYYAELSEEEVKEKRADWANINCELLLSLPLYLNQLEEADQIRMLQPFGHQLTKEQLESETFSLAQLVVQSDHVSVYWVQSNSEDTVAARETFYKRTKEILTGLCELETRPDAAAALLAVYDYYAGLSDEEATKEKASSAIANCELLLSLPLYFDQLEEADQVRVSTLLGW